MEGGANEGMDRGDGRVSVLTRRKKLGRLGKMGRANELRATRRTRDGEVVYCSNASTHGRDERRRGRCGRGPREIPSRRFRADVALGTNRGASLIDIVCIKDGEDRGFESSRATSAEGSFQNVPCFHVIRGFQNLHASSSQRLPEPACIIKLSEIAREASSAHGMHRQVTSDGNSAPHSASSSHQRGQGWPVQLTVHRQITSDGNSAPHSASLSHHRWRGRPAQLIECIVKVISDGKGAQLSSRHALSSHQQWQGRPAQLMECIVHGASSSRRRGRGRPAQLREGRLK